jgi:CBS domain-containing protein
VTDGTITRRKGLLWTSKPKEPPVKISDVMTAQVVSATPQNTIQEVASIMAQIDSGVVPVVDGGKVIGLVTDRDIVIRVVAAGGALGAAISTIMSDDVQSCQEDDSVADAAAKMGSHQIRRLVVYDAAGKLTGIVSLGDIAQDFGAKVVGHTLEEISAE